MSDIPQKYVQLRNALNEVEGLFTQVSNALKSKDPAMIQTARDLLLDWKAKYKDSHVVACLYMALMAVISNQSPFNEIDSLLACLDRISVHILSSATSDAIESVRCLSVGNFVGAEAFAATASVKARSIK